MYIIYPECRPSDVTCTRIEKQKNIYTCIYIYSIYHKIIQLMTLNRAISTKIHYVFNNIMLKIIGTTKNIIVIMFFAA